jgi:subtilase family serine protease
VGSIAVAQTGISSAQGASLPDLTPTPITVNGTNHPGSGPPVQIGSTAHFDSGIANLGDTGTDVFNVRWLVDGQNVNPPAYGSYAGIPAHTTVLNGNSQFDWVPSSPGAHTITFIVDVDNQVMESNESNSATSIKVTATPDAPH